MISVILCVLLIIISQFLFLFLFSFFFFFKQKAAYELRISDWSSDVCSSDLPARRPAPADLLEPPWGQGGGTTCRPWRSVSFVGAGHARTPAWPAPVSLRASSQRAPAEERRPAPERSAERRVGKACVSQFISRSPPCHSQPKNTKHLPL